MTAKAADWMEPGKNLVSRDGFVTPLKEKEVQYKEGWFPGFDSSLFAEVAELSRPPEADEFPGPELLTLF